MEVFDRCIFAMNTRFPQFPGETDPERSEAWAAIVERALRTQERTMSRFDVSGPLADLNCRAAQSKFGAEELFPAPDEPSA